MVRQQHPQFTFTGIALKKKINGKNWTRTSPVGRWI
jgi:hypothetical protein